MINVLKKIEAQRFFLIAAIFLQVCYTIFRPPFQSPDEFNHFCRAYQISIGNFTPQLKEKRLGGELPMAIWDYFCVFKEATCYPDKKISHKVILQSFEIKMNQQVKGFLDFPNTANYSPISYLPSSGTIFLLNKVTNSVALIYYGSIYVTFLFWLASMYAVIKILPVFKWVFVALLLNPMQMYLLNSCSGDHVNNISAFALLALILKIWFGDKKIRNEELIMIITLALLLAFTKIVYVSMILLLVLIESNKFGSKSKKILICVAASLLCFGAAAYWSSLSLKKSITYEQYNPSNRDWVTIKKGADQALQKQWLKDKPSRMIVVVLKSIYDDPIFYLRSYIGHFGTYMDLPVADWFYISIYILLIILVLTDSGNFKMMFQKKLFLLLVAFVTFSILILSQFITWSEVGSDHVETIQGRYLIPVFPLIFLLFHSSKIKFKLQSGILAMCIIVFMNIYALNLIWSRFF